MRRFALYAAAMVIAITGAWTISSQAGTCTVIGGGNEDCILTPGGLYRVPSSSRPSYGWDILPGIKNPQTCLPEKPQDSAGRPSGNLPVVICPGQNLSSSLCPDFPGTISPDKDQPEERPGQNPGQNQPEEKPGQTKPDPKPEEKPGQGTNTNPSDPLPRPDDEAREYIEKVIQLVNEERAKNGLSPVRESDAASDAAAVRAREITRSFSHTRPNGAGFATALTESGVRFNSSGENIAYGQRTPEAVMNTWMNSQGHRANILNRQYTSIGVGYYVDSRGVAYWVQLFTN